MFVLCVIAFSEEARRYTGTGCPKEWSVAQIRKGTPANNIANQYGVNGRANVGMAETNERRARLAAQRRYNEGRLGEDSTRACLKTDKRPRW